MRLKIEEGVGSTVVPVHALALIAAKTTSSFQSHRTLVLGVGLALGVIIFLLGIPLFLKKVKPNRVYGLAPALKYESRTTWYAGNRYFGAALMIAGALTIIGTIVFWIVKPLQSSNKLLALVELLIIVGPAAAAYAISAMHLDNL